MYHDLKKKKKRLKLMKLWRVNSSSMAADTNNNSKRYSLFSEWFYPLDGTCQSTDVRFGPFLGAY